MNIIDETNEAIELATDSLSIRDVIHNAMARGLYAYVRLASRSAHLGDGAVVGRPTRLHARRLVMMLPDGISFAIDLDQVCAARLVPWRHRDGQSAPNAPKTSTPETSAEDENGS